MQINIQIPNGTSLQFSHVDGTSIALSDLLHEFEKAVIGEALKSCGGVKAQVALMLKMNRTTLVEKSKRYGFPLNR